MISLNLKFIQNYRHKMTKLVIFLIFALVQFRLIKSSEGVLLNPKVIPQSYKLSLELSNGINQTRFAALANITLIFHESNHRAIVLNSKNLKFRANWRVMRQGIINIRPNLLEEDLEAETVKFTVSRVFDVGIEYSLIVEYEGVVSDEEKKGLFMNFYRNDVGEDDVMLMTQMAPIYLRNIIPCVDEPQVRSVFKLEVHNVPEGYEVISNGLDSTKTVNETSRYESLHFRLGSGYVS